MMTHPTDKLLVYIDYMSASMRSGSSSESKSEDEYHPSQVKLIGPRVFKRPLLLFRHGMAAKIAASRAAC
jgi:hypothetical protein